MNGFLLDTNVVSELRKGPRADGRVVAWHTASLHELRYLSVITIGEICEGIENVAARDPAQAASLERWLTAVRAEFTGLILPVTERIAERWGRLSVRQRPAVEDGLIAATALEHGLTVATRNTADFQFCGVPVINPFLY